MVFKGKAWAIWESSSSSFLGLFHMYKRYTMTCTPIYILEKTLMLEKIEGKKRRGWQRMRWLDGISDSTDMSLNSRR